MNKKMIEDKTGLPCHWCWSLVPEGLNTKTQLKKMKIWKEGIKPVATKGNTQNNQTNFYFLYKKSDFE